MFFSQTAEYALRAAVLLAREPDKAQSTQNIASLAQAPPDYLYKVVQAMRRAGLVESQRGVGGGIRLARPPEHITVLDVVNAVDPIQRIHTCPLKLKSHGTNLCPLHRSLDDAIAHVEQALAAATIADLITSPDAPMPLCETVSNHAGPNDKPDRDDA